MNKKANNLRAALLKSLSKLPKQYGEGWLPYLTHGVGGSALKAFTGNRGLANLRKGLLPASVVGGATFGLDYQAGGNREGEGRIDHGITNSALTSLALLSPGLRRAAGQASRRYKGNMKLVNQLRAGGLGPNQATVEATQTPLASLYNLLGKTVEVPKMAPKDILKNIFSTNKELKIQNLTNATQSADVTRKAMGSAVKRWGVNSMDAGEIQNPEIFHGLMEGDMNLRRALSRMGYQRLRGFAGHSKTREVNKDLMDALLVNAVNNSKGKRFRAGDYSGAIPDYDTAGDWFARKGLVSDRYGSPMSPGEFDYLSPKTQEKIRKNLMEAFGIRHDQDWYHAADRAAAAATSYAGIDPSKLSYGKFRLPKAKDPSVVLPPKPNISKLYDVDTQPVKFDIDLKKWNEERKALKKT